MPWHRCPVCGCEHRVSDVAHRLACGRVLTCSPACKLRRRQQVLASASVPALAPPTSPIIRQTDDTGEARHEVEL